MSKPNTMLDLKIGGHISSTDVTAIARAIFNTELVLDGPEGYTVTGVNFDELPRHVREFIEKAILQFTVTNVLDVNRANADDTPVNGDPDETPDPDDENPYEDEYTGH
jgi:hypothetical protein